MEVDSGQEMHWETKHPPPPSQSCLASIALSQTLLELEDGFLPCQFECVGEGEEHGGGDLCARAQDEDLETQSQTGLSPECPF